MVGHQKLKSIIPDELSTTLTLDPDQRTWVLKHYPTFVSSKKTRGVKTQDNAQKWVTETIVPLFLKEFYGDTSETEKEEQFLVLRADYTIYATFSNEWKRDPANPKAVTSATTKANGKIYAGDLWAKAHPDVVEEAVNKHLEDNPQQEQIAARRTVVCQLFNDLSAEQRGPWERKAEADKKMGAVKAAQPLTGEARERFARAGLDLILKTMKDLQQKCGALGVSYIAVEKPGDNARLVIHTMGCDALAEFTGNAGELAETVTKQTSKRVEGGKPPAAVVPGKDGRPIIPDLGPNPHLFHVRRVVRVGIAGNWLFVGGDGPVPWLVVQRAIDEGNFNWIPKERLPVLGNGDIAPFMDPGKMNMEVAIAFYHQLRIYQEKPPNWELTMFQFEQVYSSPNHVWPSECADSHKEMVRRGNREAILVRYSGFVERPQVCGVIPYPLDTWEWSRYLLDQTTSDIWKGLPSRPDTQISPVISEREASVYTFWFENIKEDYSYVRELVNTVVANVNHMESLVPLWARHELWDQDDKSPRLPSNLPILPPSDEHIDYLVTNYQFWIPSLFCSPDEADSRATLYYMEIWQKKMRTGVLYHKDSGSFAGGKFGVVWVIRALLPVLANAAAACAYLPPPIPAPYDCDLERLSPADFRRIVSWVSDWNDLLSASCGVLSESHQQRIQPLGTFEEEPATEKEDEDADGSDGEIPDNPNPTARELAGTLETLAQRAPLPRKAKNAVRLRRTDETDTTESTALARVETEIEIELESSDEDVRAKSASRDLLKVPRRPSVDFKTREHLFNRPVLPLKVTQFIGGTGALKMEMKKFVESCTKMVLIYLKTHKSVGKPYSSKMIDQVRKKVADADDASRLLLDCVYAHRGAWLKAEKLSVQGSTQHAAFWNFLRSGARILVAFDRLASEYSDVERLRELRNEVAAWTWVCRLGFEQFGASAKLSTMWANRLEDAWERVSNDTPFEELATLVAEIRDWRDDYLALVKYFRSYRRMIMKYHIDGDIHGMWKDCWYTYGNPGEQAMTGETEELVKEIPPRFSCVRKVHGGSNERTGLSDDEAVMVNPSVELDPELFGGKFLASGPGVATQSGSLDTEENSTSRQPDEATHTDSSQVGDTTAANTTGAGSVNEHAINTELGTQEGQTTATPPGETITDSSKPDGSTSVGPNTSGGNEGERGAGEVEGDGQRKSARVAEKASSGSGTTRNVNVSPKAGRNTRTPRTTTQKRNANTRSDSDPAPPDQDNKKKRQRKGR